MALCKWMKNYSENGQYFTWHGMVVSYDEQNL